MLQCKLAPRLSGYIILAPSLKSTEDGDGNWRIYVSWHGFLAHCPPSLSHSDSSVVCVAIFNPINLKLTALYNPYPSPFVRLIFLYLSILTPLPLLRMSSSSQFMPPRVYYTLLHCAGKWQRFSAVHLVESCCTCAGPLNTSCVFWWDQQWRLSENNEWTTNGLGRNDLSNTPEPIYSFPFFLYRPCPFPFSFSN